MSKFFGQGSRTLRDLGDLMNDPNFPLHVGRLVGAAEMVGYHLVMKEDPELKDFGARLLTVADWFIEEGHVTKEVKRGAAPS